MKLAAVLIALVVLCSATPTASAREPDVTCRIPVPATQPPPQTAHPEHAFGIGSGIPVAVIDTGVADHPALGGVEAVADLVVPEAPNPLHDCDGHGTIVAGIIAARGGPLVGVAPGARILSIRQSSAHYRRDTSENKDPAGTLSSLAQAIDLAITHGARVINASVAACVPAGTTFDSSLLDAALQRAEAAGTVVVAAAGNASADCPADAAVYPAAAPTVLSVAARDDAYQLSGYSIPTAGRFLSASGFVPIGLSPTGEGLVVGMDQVTTGFEGTSFAAPVVAGMAALLIEREPDASPARIRELLLATAHPPLGSVTPQMLAGPAVALSPSDQLRAAPLPAVAPRVSWWRQPAGQRVWGLGAGGVLIGVGALLLGGMRRSGAQR